MTPNPSPAPNPASERLYCLRREHRLDRNRLAYLTGIRPGDILTAETVDPSVLTAPEWDRVAETLDTDPSYFQDVQLSDETGNIYRLSMANMYGRGTDLTVTVRLSCTLTDEQKTQLHACLRDAHHVLNTGAPEEWDERRAVMDGLRAFKSKTGVAWQFVRDPITDTITF